MEQKIKKNFNKILAIFILMQPVLDLITGVFIHVFNINLTIGIIIRMLFLIFIMLTVTFIYKKKKILMYYFLFLIYAFFYILGIIMFKNGVGLFAEIQGLLRVFYFPLLLVSLYSIKDNIRISKMTLVISLFMYLLFIFVPNSLNIGFKSYQITKSGTLGFFNSANEISGIISIITPIMVIIFKENKNFLLIFLMSILYLVVILTIGTKTPLLSFCITILSAILWLWIRSIKRKNYKVIFASLIAVLVLSVGIILILPKTNFYKNIKVHMNYLKVDDLGDVLEKPKLIDHFIFSQRLTFLDKKQALYEKATIYQKLFGIGYLKEKKVAKAVEMDYFDIFYSHGIIGCLIFFIAYIYVLINILKNRKKLNFSQYMLYISLILILFLSLFTGHIITAPSVSIIVITIIMMLENKKRRLVFTANNLNIGGIEKALVNLVNKIDSNKYDTSIILENKSGILLKEINSNIEVKEFKISNNKNVIIRKVYNLIKRLNFTIINYNTYDFSCCYATYSFSGNKLAKILSQNNSIYIHSNYKYLYKNEEELKSFFDNRKLENFHHIIFVSNESREDYLKYYSKLQDKTLVINNFVDIFEINKLASQKIELKKPKNKKLFVFVGRLDDSSKKVSRAILLTKNIDNINLWIIGDGPDKSMYQDLVKDNKLEEKVKFLGSKKNPYPYMNIADYIILTSNYEGFPVVYLEAITLSKKIITTIDVSDETINIGKDYAYIVSKEDDKMIKQVNKILKDNKKLSYINLDEIQQNRMKKLEELFDEVI